MRQLKISQEVMGNVYVPQKIQHLCQRGVAVIPREMVVFKDGDGEKSPNQAMVVFMNGSTKHQLALSLFENPPSVQDLMKVLPYTVKPATQPCLPNRRGRFCVLDQPQSEL